MIDTGKVTKIIDQGDKVVAEINFFIDNFTKMVVLPPEESDKYKDKYVICAIDSDDNTQILEIVDA